MFRLCVKGHGLERAIGDRWTVVAGIFNFNSLETSRPLVLALPLTVRSIPEHA